VLIVVAVFLLVSTLIPKVGRKRETIVKEAPDD
jgi:hypothetical protein